MNANTPPDTNAEISLAKRRPVSIASVVALVSITLLVAVVVRFIGLLISPPYMEMVFPVRNALRHTLIPEHDYSSIVARMIIDFIPFPGTTLLLGWLAALTAFVYRKATASNGSVLCAGIILSLLGLAYNVYYWSTPTDFISPVLSIFGLSHGFFGLAAFKSSQMSLQLASSPTIQYAFAGTSVSWLLLWATEAWIMVRGIRRLSNKTLSRGPGLFAIFVGLIIVPFAASFVLSAPLASTPRSVIASFVAGIVLVGCIWFTVRLATGGTAEENLTFKDQRDVLIETDQKEDLE